MTTLFVDNEFTKQLAQYLDNLGVGFTVTNTYKGESKITTRLELYPYELRFLSNRFLAKPMISFKSKGNQH